MNNFLELGQIVNTRGLRGEVKVNSFTDDNTKFERIKSIFVKKKDEIKEYEIQKVSYSKNQVILKLKGIDHIDYAEKLRNAYVLVDRESLDPLPDGVYYIADLIGLEVFTEEGLLLGKVDDIFSTGSNDVYVVKAEDGTERLLPGIDEVLKKIDIDNKKIIVNLIEGL